MKAEFVILADAAHVRDGLFNVIGGGINRVRSDKLPALLRAAIVAKILVESPDLNKKHTVDVKVTREDGDEQLATFSGTFLAHDPPPDSWEPALLTSIAIDGLLLPSYGFYNLSFNVDDQPMKAIRIQVERMPATPGRAARRHPANPTVKPRRPRK